MQAAWHARRRLHLRFALPSFFCAMSSWQALEGIAVQRRLFGHDNNCRTPDRGGGQSAPYSQPYCLSATFIYRVLLRHAALHRRNTMEALGSFVYLCLTLDAKEKRVPTIISTAI